MHAAAPSADHGAGRILEMFGYTTENNPFGDPNLTKQFVWKKKVDKDVAAGKAVAPPTAAELEAKRDAMMDEIERARERRKKREEERKKKEEEDKAKKAAEGDDDDDDDDDDEDRKGKVDKLKKEDL